MTTPGYPHFHKDRLNLTIHIVMVPVFVAGVLGAAWSAATGRWIWMAVAAALPVLSLATQGLGHKREPNPPLRFEGPGHFLERIFKEQFFGFPKFVLSGNWLAAWKAPADEQVDRLETDAPHR